MTEFADARVFLDPRPHRTETGVERLDSGTLLVSARTDMPACKGRMFDWWFRFAPDTEQYSWWHPIDHVSSEWRGLSGSSHVGSTHVVREKLGGDEIFDLQIGFIDEDEFFGGDHAARAREAGQVSSLVCAHLGIGHDGPLDDAGRPVGGRMCHIARDTADGMVLRSRFWLGHDAPEELAREIPDAMGLALMQHAITEFKYLAAFLPSLYIAGAQDVEPAPSVW